MTSSLSLAASCGLLVTCAVAQGDITTVDPFVGDHSEDFDEATTGFHASLGIFLSDPESDGEANGFLEPAFITSFSSFMGSTIVSRSGPHFSHMTGPVEYVFTNPVRMFGGYFATNSGSDGGTVEFFDDEGTRLETLDLDVTFAPGTAEYTWNGWASDTPFSRVRVSSNGVLEGFLGFDDMQMSFVPAPAASVLLLPLALGARSRRRRD